MNESGDMCYGWMFHAVYKSGDEYIYYSNEPFETKKEATEDMNQFIADEKSDNELVTADNKSVSKNTGDGKTKSLKAKFPESKVEGV